jgi:hypothetical protein
MKSKSKTSFPIPRTKTEKRTLRILIRAVREVIDNHRTPPYRKAGR